MKAASLCVPEIATFTATIGQYRHPLVTDTVEHINSARAESTNDMAKKAKKRGRGFGGFAETRKAEEKARAAAKARKAWGKRR